YARAGASGGADLPCPRHFDRPSLSPELRNPAVPKSDNPAFPLTFTAGPIDRAALMRSDETRIREWLTNGRTNIVPVWNQRHLVTSEHRAHFFSYEDAAAMFDLDQTPLVFLGHENETSWFALGLPGADEPPALNVDGRFAALNEVVTLLPVQE